MVSSFIHLPPAALLLPVGTVLLMVHAHSAWRACAHVLFAGSVAWIVPLSWVRTPSLLSGSLSPDVAWIWPALLAVGMTTYPALVALCIRMAARHCGPLLLGFYAGMSWFVMELLRTTWCKAPMMQFVAGLSAWPWMIQSCSLAGAFGLAGIIVACAFWLLLPETGNSVFVPTIVSFLAPNPDS